MPAYDLGCDCGYTEIDVTMTVSNYESATCPKCGDRLRSIKFPSAFNLKGGGWTPVYTGPERKRTRQEVLGEANHEYKKREKIKKAAMERNKRLHFEV